MDFILLIPFFFTSHLILNSAQASRHSSNCCPFYCGTMGKVGYPFSNRTNPDCGLYEMKCFKKKGEVQFRKEGKRYRVEGILYKDSILRIRDTELESCDALNNFASPSSEFLSLDISSSAYFLKCNHEQSYMSRPEIFGSFSNFTGCSDYVVYYSTDPNSILPSETIHNRCSTIKLPAKIPVLGQNQSIFPWGSVFYLHWKVDPLCDNCYNKGGHCVYNNKTIQCNGLPEGSSKAMRNVGIGVGAGAGVLLLACVFFLIRLRRKKHQSKSSALISRSLTPDSSIKPDLERGTSSYFQTPIFSYAELQEATDNFDSSKEIGDGGFGTVYHGTLRDGRVVAVKRLYENNYKRHDQFMNELEILSRLRHRNLVTLYGCTTRHSRELLLVYEYIPNGTVADNLHGDRASTSPLTWPVRLSVAIETADALSYLHASDIIHRDVKTTNILLDHNFHVKVADFGLSRLFPINATHVSTAPQGTPGYVDPEYYQCYQLNDKSDVYSFGVVLIELISSKPAVDIGRHRHEINLSNMAINKIHNDALHELVDPSLGFESDYSVRRMITMVAELAFRCLQQEKEMRPCMMEVLKCLKDIESAEKVEKAEEVDIPADARLLKNVPPFSPTSVTDKWVSSTTTPNTSG